MPYIKEHSARIEDPAKYINFRRENDKFGDGIDVIFGITKEGKAEIQAIRFDATKYSFDEMKKWIEEHNYKPIEIEEAKQELQVFPRGEYIINGEKLNFDDKFFQEMIDNFNNPKLAKPFLDKNHEERESYGEIKNLFVKDDGLYAEIEFNEDGRNLIKDKKYRYLSPAFGVRIDTDGKKHNNVLFTVSLTNKPALEGTIPQLQKQLKMEVFMDKTKKILNQILAKGIIKMENEPKDQDLDAQIAEILGKLYDKMQEMSEMALQIKQLQDEKEALTNQVEEEKTKNEQLEQEKMLKEATEQIKLAVDQGQYPVALMEMKIQQYMKDKEAIQKELELLPKKQNLKSYEQLEISEEDLKIARFAHLDLAKKEDLEILKKIKEK